MKRTILFFFLLFISLPGSAQNSLTGDWEGAIDVQGQKLVVVFHINGEAGNYSGTLDIPQQGAKGLKLTRAEQRQDSVILAFQAGQVSGRFNGTLAQDTLIRGSYTQGISMFPFRLTKKQDDGEKGSLGAGKDLIIHHKGNKIGGTLVLPPETKATPVVVMISGSGAQKRDSDVFDFRIFATMADHLKKEGIASFRYDDRETGISTGSFSDATLDTLATDIKSIVQHLSDSVDYEFSEVILLGHSQGGVVAGRLAADYNEIDRLILMASPGVSLKEVLRFQVRQAFGPNIYPREEIMKEITAREKLMVALREGEGVEKAKLAYVKQYTSMIRSLPQKQRNTIPDVDAFAQRQADQLEQMYGTPQMQSFLFHDPTSDLKKVNIPVLVLFGEKDTQITEELNKEPIKQALEKAGTDYEIKTFPEANHLFQKADSGRASEYALLDDRFVDGFLNTLSGWVKSK